MLLNAFNVIKFYKHFYGNVPAQLQKKSYIYVHVHVRVYFKENLVIHTILLSLYRLLLLTCHGFPSHDYLMTSQIILIQI